MFYDCEVRLCSYILIIGVCILLRVYPVMLINHRTQQCLVLVFIVHLTLHVSAPIGGHLQVLCDKIYSKVATFMSTDPLSRHI
jgi:hypothetical protein